MKTPTEVEYLLLAEALVWRKRLSDADPEVGFPPSNYTLVKYIAAGIIDLSEEQVAHGD